TDTQATVCISQEHIDCRPIHDRFVRLGAPLGTGVGLLKNVLVEQMGGKGFRKLERTVGHALEHQRALANVSHAQPAIEISPRAELIRLVEDGTISGKIGKEIFEESYRTGEAPLAIVERRGVQQISDEAALWEIVEQVVTANAKQAEAYASGKDGLFGFFVGQVMKATQGRANPVITSDLLHKRLGR
ncbi:MAG TPA: hypothetical protein VIV58_25620, partial [Kofleriaceae bacterium]